MKLNQKQVDKIWDAYEKKGSLRAVHRTTPHSLSTIYKYVAQKYVIKHQKLVQSVQTTDECLIGTYVGLWMGDGTQYLDRGQYIVKFCSNTKNINLNQFITNIIWELFRKKVNYCKNKKNNELYIRCSSRFIYKFIKNYATYEKNKTATVHLHKETNKYSNDELKGILLGLMLSDGYLKDKAVFRSTSPMLAKNFFDILKQFNYKPHLKKEIRREKNWNDITTVRLRKQESQALEEQLNSILLQIGTNMKFSELKYE